MGAARKRGLSAAHSRAVTPVAVTPAARVGAVRPGPGSSPLAGSLRLCADVHGRTGDPLHVEEEVTCLLAAVVHGPAAAILGAVVCGGVGFAGEAHLRPGQGGRGVAAHLEDVLGSVAHLAVVAEGDARAATGGEESALACSDGSRGCSAVGLVDLLGLARVLPVDLDRALVGGVQRPPGM